MTIEETSCADSASVSTAVLEDGWIVEPVESGVHVMPNGETHERSIDCWCSPTDDDGVVIHASADNREAFENGARKPN